LLARGPSQLAVVHDDHATRDEVLEVGDHEALLVSREVRDVEADGAHVRAERLLTAAVGSLLLTDEQPQLGGLMLSELVPSFHATPEYDAAIGAVRSRVFQSSGS
jgi:hypothetical protein